jgi:hypothetical protein
MARPHDPRATTSGPRGKMIGVGIMVGIVIIAMYLPVFKMLTLVR